MTDRTFDIQDIDICIDCAMLIANGGGDSVDSSWCPTQNHESNCYGSCEQAATAHADAVERNWPTSDGWVLHVGSHECEWCGTEERERDESTEDCEPWFSWSSCHGCGAHLGGNRMHGIAMRETTEATG